MAKAVVDLGPAAAQALTVAVAAVNNIGVTIIDRAGPVYVNATFTVNNPAASAPTVTMSVRKNGVIVVTTTRTVVMVASTRISVQIEHVDLGAVVGDVFALEINTSAAVAAHELTANQTSMSVHAFSQDAATCAGIGAVTA